MFWLAAAVACVAWTVTHEEVFRELRDACQVRSRDGRTILVRKFFYLFTCEYCFSHWVAAALVWWTGYRLASGVIVTVFAVVALANVYMSSYFILRLLVRYLGKVSK